MCQPWVFFFFLNGTSNDVQKWTSGIITQSEHGGILILFSPPGQEGRFPLGPVPASFLSSPQPAFYLATHRSPRLGFWKSSEAVGKIVHVRCVCGPKHAYVCAWVRVHVAPVCGYTRASLALSRVSSLSFISSPIISGSRSHMFLLHYCPHPSLCPRESADLANRWCSRNMC